MLDGFAKVLATRRLTRLASANCLKLIFCFFSVNATRKRTHNRRVVIDNMCEQVQVATVTTRAA